jgi:hypothetical protein
VADEGDCGEMVEYSDSIVVIDESHLIIIKLIIKFHSIIITLILVIIIITLILVLYKSVKIK